MTTPTPTPQGAMPEFPSNITHVMRRIRLCENEAAAQLVLENAMHAYASAATQQAAGAVLELPVAWRGREFFRGEDEGWSNWREIHAADMDSWKRRMETWPGEFEIRPLYAAPPPPAQAGKPLTDDELNAVFAKHYPSDAALLAEARHNRDMYLETIGARHHWGAFKIGARAIEAAHGITAPAAVQGEEWKHG